MEKFINRMDTVKEIIKTVHKFLCVTEAIFSERSSGLENLKSFDQKNIYFLPQKLLNQHFCAAHVYLSFSPRN